jgi:ribosomal protein L7/L12
MTSEHLRYVSLIRASRAAGDTVDDALEKLRLAGADIIESMKALREAEEISLGEAKRLVDESATWAEARESNEHLRALAERALSDEEDGVDQRPDNAR